MQIIPLNNLHYVFSCNSFFTSKVQFFMASDPRAWEFTVSLCHLMQSLVHGHFYYVVHEKWQE